MTLSYSTLSTGKSLIVGAGGSSIEQENDMIISLHLLGLSR